jgi:hypothetical protein
MRNYCGNLFWGADMPGVLLFMRAGKIGQNKILIAQYSSWRDLLKNLCCVRILIANSHHKHH